MNIIQQLEAEQAAKLVAARAIPEFQPGDTVIVNVKVKEGERSRVQAYEGVCIARGGMRVGDVLSRIFKLPLAIISTHSYEGEAGTVRGDITVAKYMTMTTPSLGNRVLVVDDLVDSGVTLDVVRKHLMIEYPSITDIRTAVLWYKAVSKYVPDYFVEYLADSPWIHQPFEEYDTMRPDRLAKKFAV